MATQPEVPPQGTAPLSEEEIQSLIDLREQLLREFLAATGKEEVPLSECVEKFRLYTRVDSLLAEVLQVAHSSPWEQFIAMLFPSWEELEASLREGDSQESSPLGKRDSPSREGVLEESPPWALDSLPPAEGDQEERPQERETPRC